MTLAGRILSEKVVLMTVFPAVRRIGDRRPPKGLLDAELGSGVGLCSAHLYLPLARHTTPSSLQPFRVSLPKELWWILTLEVLWRSVDLAWMTSPRFPLRMLFATPTPWAPTSTIPSRLPLSFFRWPLANTRLLVILLEGPLQIS
jgi:hypothetical protein